MKDLYLLISFVSLTVFCVLNIRITIQFCIYIIAGVSLTVLKQLSIKFLIIYILGFCCSAYMNYLIFNKNKKN